MPKTITTRIGAQAEVNQLRPGLAICHRYDSKVKADLFSTAIETGSGLFFIDPIVSWDFAALAGIVITNANHVRESVALAAHFNAPVYAAPEVEFASATELRDGDLVGGELRVITIAGAAPGEIALHSAREGGTLVIGDALINFGSNGFSILPAKYCTNQKLMRKSLPRLLEFNFERMLFAHGPPIMTKARERLAALLAEAT